MLNIEIEAQELFVPDKNEFVTIDAQVLSLEHSLVSISKWEEKWHKPFLDPKRVSTEAEIVDYIKCMNMNEHTPDEVYQFLSASDVAKIKAYMEDPHTATTIQSYGKNGSNHAAKVTTSEEIYYMMFSYSIPKECEHWHINRLLTLIEVFSVKNDSGKKMSRKEILQQNAALNAQRRAAMHSKG